MENNEDLPEIQTKVVNGIEISNLEFSKIAMISDYLILDRFQEFCTYFRLEKCFAPFFIKESPDFLVSVFREICGPKKKYISFPRLILAYTKWKSKSSTNENFNKFMNIVFNDMIYTNGKKIGEYKEGGRIFSTRNTNGRKVISRFSVLTDDSKNKIKGFHIQYDDVFDTILSPIKERNDITLEINFIPNGKNIRDRDGISHIGGKYSVTKGIIKFMIFKCRSGKTFYIGDNKEEEGEEIKYFLYGTSSCQLKSIRIGLINDELNYFEPKFQPSLRVNLKIIDFDSLDEKYINDNIINEKLIFEENEIQEISIEKLEESNGLIIPCINDDTFIDKKELIEPLCGKNFNEFCKSYIVQKSEIEEKEKQDLQNKIYEKTIMRKHLLRVYLKKFKVKENISILKANKQPKTRISQDKFLAKIKAYRNKMDKNIEKKKEELRENDSKEGKDSNDDGYWDDGEEKDWPLDYSIEIKEEIKIEDKKEENKIEINNDISLKENEIIISNNEKDIPVEQEKIVLKGKTKLLKNKFNNLIKEKEKEEEEKEKENSQEEKVIMKVEQKIEESKKEQNNEAINEIVIKEDKKIEEKNQTNKNKNSDNNNKNKVKENNKNQNIKNQKSEKKDKWFCNIY